jgi:hypothetical protein
MRKSLRYEGRNINMMDYITHREVVGSEAMVDGGGGSR